MERANSATAESLATSFVKQNRGSYGIITGSIMSVVIIRATIGFY